MTTRVLIVDDQALVRAGFRMIIDAEQDMRVVGEAGDGVQALELSRRQKPDVILMDIRMPNMDGIEATRRLTEPGDGARVIILTTYDTDDEIARALKAGA